MVYNYVQTRRRFVTVAMCGNIIFVTSCIFVKIKPSCREKSGWVCIQLERCRRLCKFPFLNASCDSNVWHGMRSSLIQQQGIVKTMTSTMIDRTYLRYHFDINRTAACFSPTVWTDLYVTASANFITEKSLFLSSWIRHYEERASVFITRHRKIVTDLCIWQNICNGIYLPVLPRFC